jgi:hypothetical protein
MRTVLVLLPLLLTDCAAQRALEAQEAKTKLVGMSDERILACMGPPQNRSALGGTEVWQYSSGNGHMDAHEFGTASVTGGTGFVNTNASVSSRFCTINFAMSNHVV